MRFNKILSSALIVFLLLTIVSITKNLVQFEKIKKRISEAEAKVVKLEKQKGELIYSSEEKKKTDYLEKEIRDKLKMVRSGEVLVVLPKGLVEKDDDDMYKYSTEEGEVEEKEAIYQKWIKVFI